MFVIKLLVIALFLANSANSQNQKNFISIAEFKTLPFGFPTPQDKTEAIENGFYNASLVPRPYGIAILTTLNLKFITIPRVDPTLPVPYSLAIVTKRQTKQGPELKAYPNYEIHKIRGKISCDLKIVSVFRPNVDKCGRLWVIDTGRIGANQVCPPKIIAFNPKTGNIIHQYTFPEGIYIPGKSMFSNFNLKSEDLLCRKNIFYINDPRGHRMVIYNQEKRYSWYIEQPSFKPEDKYINAVVNGTSFNFEDGIYQINLNKSHVIYHSHASVSEYGVPISLINDGYIWKQNPQGIFCAFSQLGNRKVQWSASVVDSTGTMYGCYTTPSAIYKWDTAKPYTEENQILVARNDLTLQYCSNAKIVDYKDLYVLTTRLQKAYNGTYELDEVNFRILKCPLNALNLGIDC